MNANIQNLIRRWVPGLGMICLLAGGTCLQAETTRQNPLRSGKVVRAVSDENGSDVDVQAAAYTPVVESQRVARRPSTELNSPYRPAMNGSIPRHQPRGFVPRHELIMASQVEEEPIETLMPPIADEEVFVDGLPAEGEFMDTEFSKGMDGCGECYGDSCGDCGDGGCGDGGCLIPCPIFTFRYFEFFGGAQGFTGPTNRGETGSFGFHYGVNWAAPVPCMPNRALGMQIGYRGVNSNYSGAESTDDSRNQGFLTAGLFRRVDWGLQGGVVVDYLKDEWYYDLSLTQVRGELSWVFPARHELGFSFASSSDSAEVDSALLVNGQTSILVEQFTPTDMYTFFYRHRFERHGGGYAKLYAGGTGDSEGIIGADFKMPLTEDWALQGGFTYLIPQDSNQRIAHAQEAWNVGISMVWYPGWRKSVGNDYFRPLFDVADNGSFIVR